MVKSLAQLKIDAKNNGWPWKIDHPNDERALLDGCYPDIDEAMKLHRFFRKLLKIPRETRRRIPRKHRARCGSIQDATKPFGLLGWWFRDVLAPLYGWKKPNGSRRFDKGFVTTGKKSAKSSTLAGLPLYTIAAEGIQQAEAYTTAVDRNQAGIVFSKTSWATQNSPLASVLKVLDSTKMIKHHASGSIFRVLSPDKDSAQGYNPNLLICDELHAWRNREFFEAVMYGDISRDNALFLMITTAGDDEQSIGFEEYEFAKALLDPANDFYSQNHFAFIAEADDDKEYDDPEGWKQANPSLACGAVGSIEKLQGKCREISQSPAKRRAWRRYISNRWTVEVPDVWIPIDSWDACPSEQHILPGAECWGGLDLAESEDLSSFCAAIWSGDIINLEWIFWMPSEGIKEKEIRWKAPLRDWIDAGWIRTTEGNTTDYGVLRRDISGAMFDDQGAKLSAKYPDSIAERYNVQEIAYDKWNAKELCEAMLFNQDNMPMLEHAQTVAGFNEPSKKFARLVADGRINHGGNPVARWMISHCVAPPDANKNIKPHKGKSRHKIDGVVSAVMAVGRAVLHEDDSTSVYAESDVFYL